MKKNFKCLALMAAALLMGFSSCSNDNDPQSDGDKGPKQSVYLKINKAAVAGTKAEGPAQKAEEIKFGSGDVYFADAQGNIKRHLTISSAATTTTNLNLADLTSKGETVTNLPQTATMVYMVGNTPNLPTSGNISTVKKLALNVESQGDITKANLYGEALATKTDDATPTANAKFKAEITLNPTIARIELTDMTITGNVITGYQIAGIFIDNYYAQAAVDGPVVSSSKKDNGANSEPFADSTTEYPSTLKPAIYDWYSTPLAAVSNLAKPTKAAVWGYNVFAGDLVPRIVIRLTKIETDPTKGVTYDVDQFVTIKGLNASGEPLKEIKAGEIYNIAAGAFSIDETVVTPTPNLKAIDVTVTVKVASWVPVDVKPEV